MHIRGFYEFGHVLHVLDSDTHSFARADIAHVECFWAFGDMDSSSAGFVLRLRDGRRPYVDFHHWHGFEQEEDFRIDVDFLAGGQDRPEMPRRDPTRWPPGGWSSETAHLDKVLGR